jgi:uncharacterized protein (TIGR02246 family)
MLAGDPQPYVNNYADDGISMNPGAPATTGKAATLAMFQQMMQGAKLSDISFTTQDVVVSGDLAVEHGVYKWTVTPTGGPAMPDSGKFLTVWRKQADGSWKIIRDMNNTDIAPKMSP